MKPIMKLSSKEECDHKGTLPGMGVLFCVLDNIYCLIDRATQKVTEYVAFRLDQEKQRDARLTQELQTLHQRLDVLQATLTSADSLPAYKQLLRLYSELKNVGTIHGHHEPRDQAEEIRDFFFNSGWAILDPDCGTPLDPREHQVVGTEAALLPDHHHQIAATLLPGMAREGQVIRPAKVKIFVSAVETRNKQ